MNEQVLKHLQEQLAMMETMTPLPDPNSPEAEAMGHDAWMQQHAAIVEWKQQAETAALLSVPHAIWELIQEIRERESVLLGLKNEETQASE